MMTHGSQGTRVYLYDLFLGLIIDFHPRQLLPWEDAAIPIGCGSLVSLLRNLL